VKLLLKDGIIDPSLIDHKGNNFRYYLNQR
jgi:hypothetical protein